MTKSLAYYIDDEEEKALKAADLLNKVDGLEVRYLRPPADLSLKDIADDAQLFFVDWELDSKEKVPEGVIPATYKGSTFAQRLREAFTDRPVVLVTRDDLLNERSRRRYVQAQRIFDIFIPKGEMLDQPEEVVQKAQILINGFARLREVEKNWNGFLQALQAVGTEGISVGEAAVPMESAGKGDWTWEVLDISKWIHDVLFEFPGILYDSLHAATFLGISEEAFCVQEVQNLFVEARYSGAFAPPEGRWWKSRLRSSALDLMDKVDVEGDVNSYFADAFEKKYSQPLARSQCNTSGQSPADWVCFVCKEPVKINYSLLYHPDSRPVVMDDARVSFKAIRESNNVFENYFPASSRSLIEQIRDGEEND